MTPEQEHLIKQCKLKAYTARDIAKRLGVTVAEVKAYLVSIRQPTDKQPGDPTPEEIAEACKVLKAQQLAHLKASNYRPAIEHGPKYYIVVPKGLK